MRQIDKFEVAFGSVIGTDHTKTDKNNQDAFIVKKTDKALVALVADGCGSGKKSEVGANIGVKILADIILQNLEKTNGLILRGNAFWEKVQKETTAKLENLILEISEDKVGTISDFFLFTIVGTIITEFYTITFSFGDGFSGVNGEIKEIGPFPNNAPPYLAYGIIEEKIVGFKKEDLKFKILKGRLTLFVDTIFLGTDGVKDLLEAGGENIPGKDEKVGSIEQFLVEDKYYQNPDALRRRLHLINRSVTKYDKIEEKVRTEQGLLRDDTTLIVIRRKRKEDE